MLRCTLCSLALFALLTSGCFTTSDADQLFESNAGPGIVDSPDSASDNPSGAAGATVVGAAGGVGNGGLAGSAGNSEGAAGIDGSGAVAGNAGVAGSAAPVCAESYRTCQHTFRLDSLAGVASPPQLWGVFPPNVWSSGIELQKSGSNWSATVNVPWGFDVHYKYLVDGAWLVDPGKAVPTVADLQGGGRSSVLAGESCPAWDCGSVEVPDCPEAERAAHLRMVFDDAGYDAVELAGSFNNWQPASMTRIGTQWAVNLADLPWGGRVEYKFVVDGYWVQDPANYVTNPDGYGGVNSVLRVEGDWWSCQKQAGRSSSHPA